MNPRTRPPRHGRPHARASRVEPDPLDDRLNRQITEALREGAEAREALSHAISAEEARTNERTRATLQALIDGVGA
jgi:hypothetical protein